MVGFCTWDGVCLLRGTLYILRSAHTVYLCVLCGSDNKHRLFHCTALTGWFLYLRRSMFTARYVLNSTFCSHIAFMCFVWIWEQTPIISLYSINWLVFITETECVCCAVRSTFCPHSVFICFVWIWEETAIISLYSTDWLVFITETERVYCAVRSTFYVLPTQCIYVFCIDLRTNSDYFTVQH